MSKLEPTRTYSNHTATEILRHMLDERGVEYVADDGETVKLTHWPVGSEWALFIEYDTGETRFCWDTRHFVPEQAIAATMGVIE